MVRPRGWHLVDTNVLVDGDPVAAVPARLRAVLLPQRRRPRRPGQRAPTSTCPSWKSHLEARLWNDVFVAAQEALGIADGTIRATVLIETILAAFEMDEILYELRDHSAGLNAGRWDYIFSVIKKFRNDPTRVLPDRNQVTMTVPFMRAYTDLLIATCHRRGAHAMGGMAAFIPSRTRPRGQLPGVRQGAPGQGTGVAATGHDGTWVAHPDLVPRGHRGVRRRARRPAQPDSTGSAPTSSRITAVGSARLHGPRGHRHRSRRPAPTSTSASATWPPGCGATVPPASTTSWRTPPPPRSPGPRSGSGPTTASPPSRATSSTPTTCAPWPGDGRAAPRRDGRRPIRRDASRRGAPALRAGGARRPDYPEFLTIPAYEILETRSMT